jgi:hypothetical protein
MSVGIGEEEIWLVGIELAPPKNLTTRHYYFGDRLVNAARMTDRIANGRRDMRESAGSNHEHQVNGRVKQSKTVDTPGRFVSFTVLVVLSAVGTLACLTHQTSTYA